MEPFEIMINYTDDQLYEIEEKIRYLEDSSRRNILRIEESNLGSMRGEISSILKSKLKINNVKIERACRIPRRKGSRNNDKPGTIVFKFHSYEDKKIIM